jgi:hypothetical protein
MDDQVEISKELLYRAAVGKAQENFYVAKFLAFEESESSRRSWNWAAVLFGPFWFLYRRMFVFALVFGILVPALFYWMCDVAIGLILRASPESWLWSVPSFVFQCVLIPMYANYLYFSSVEKRIAALREKLPDDGAVLQALTKSRPTSILACVVGPVLVMGAYGLGIRSENSREGQIQVSAVLAELSRVQSAIVKSYMVNRTWPERAADLGFQEDIHTPYIDSLNIDRGTISVRFGNQASSLIAGRLFSIRPSLAPTGAISWSCGYASPKGKDSASGPSGTDMTNVPNRFLPWKCR